MLCFTSHSYNLKVLQSTISHLWSWVGSSANWSVLNQFMYHQTLFRGCEGLQLFKHGCKLTSVGRVSLGPVPRSSVAGAGGCCWASAFDLARLMNSLIESFFSFSLSDTSHLEGFFGSKSIPNIYISCMPNYPVFHGLLDFKLLCFFSIIWHF